MAKTSKRDYVKTSVKIPRELWKAASIRAIEDDKDLQTIVSDALAAYLKGKRR